MLSFRPITYRLGDLLHRKATDLEDACTERWEIAPAETRAVPPVIILPGQAERITHTEFADLDMVMQSLAGDPAEAIAPTLGYLLRDVDIVDGVVYAQGMSLHLRERSHTVEIGHLVGHDSGALYETWVGNRWFGNWLLDDCLSYRLAEDAGAPVTTAPARTGPRAGHVPRYEALLGMAPQRIENAHFDELIVFDDHANNAHRIARARDMRARLLRGISAAPHPGVFLLRGRSGDLRILENEAAIAEMLARDHGLRILFAEDHSVDDVMAACAGARIIAGIEGSQLNHGIAAMAPGGTLLTIQPPDRATTAMKLLSDRFEQRFAMIVGTGSAASFHVPLDDVSRTLDLIYM